MIVGMVVVVRVGTAAFAAELGIEGETIAFFKLKEVERRGFFGLNFWLEVIAHVLNKLRRFLLVLNREFEE